MLQISYLLGSRNVFNHLLQRTSPMLIQRNLNQVRCSISDQNGALVIVGRLEQLLAEIVAKGICRMNLLATRNWDYLAVSTYQS